MDPVRSKNLANSADLQANRTSNGMEDFAIKVENVSKVFKLPHEKNSSIKSSVVNFYRRKKGYELQSALKDVSFEIKKGEFFGIVGRNGSGKSTMLKLLAGIYTPTKGQIHVRGSLTPFIELGVGFNPELTGRENVFLNGALLGFNRKEMQAMYKDIVEFAELERFMDQKLKNYSSGMQVRLAFSIAIRAKSDILLIDEVLAVGDAAFQRKCFEYFKQLKKSNRTVVFISHDMGAVKEFCNRGILLNEGKIIFSGNSSEVAKKYAQLFMEDPEEQGKSNSSHPKRLGNQDVHVENVKARIIDDELVVDIVAKVNRQVDELIYGLHILAGDGNEVTAMNNRMINTPDIKNLKPGLIINFQWRMLNIFSDGKFTIMLTLVDGTYTQLDYIEEAATFSVKREERSNTAVTPPVSVTHTISES